VQDRWKLYEYWANMPANGVQKAIAEGAKEETAAAKGAAK
jgi:hypothetical protein